MSWVSQRRGSKGKLGQNDGETETRETIQEKPPQESDGREKGSRNILSLCSPSQLPDSREKEPGSHAQGCRLHEFHSISRRMEFGRTHTQTNRRETFPRKLALV